MLLKETIIGNGRIADILEKSYNSGKLAHAYLFEGSEHIGKKTLALNFCKLVLGDSGDAIQNNADLTIIGPDENKKQITIDQIRELERKLSLYPYNSNYKIALIDQAEKMTDKASNALLKTLEEPGKTTILILITSNAGSLLDTIKSRCQALKFLPVKKKLLEDYLKNRVSNKSDIEKIIEIAGYRPGKIIENINTNGKLQELVEQMDSFSNIMDKNYSEKIEEAEIVSKKETDEIINSLDLWVIYLRKKLMLAYNNRNENKNSSILLIKKRINLLLKIKEDILTKNINTRLAIENLFLGM